MSSKLVCVEDYEKKAKEILEKYVYDYIRDGAGQEISLKQNTQAFGRLRIFPKYFQNISAIDTSCKILGCNLKWPLGVSPSAIQKVIHTDGEAGNAKAAGEMGSVYILSLHSSMTIEEVAAAAPNTNKWLQTFVYNNRSLTEQFVRRAEKSGFKAIVLTCDQTIIGQRWSDARNELKVPPNMSFANFGLHYEEVLKLGKTCTFDDIKWLVKLTHLPVIAKGILTVEGAILARKAGCKGIIVSNHGARHLDTIPATIEVLPSIVQAVGDDMVVMLDSGIRTGDDIFKALALGAKMVFIGRAPVWGLACGGENGVKDLLEILHTDFVKVMTLAGCQNLNCIDKNMVVHEMQVIAHLMKLLAKL